jgi:hypothetical protein
VNTTTRDSTPPLRFEWTTFAVSAAFTVCAVAALWIWMPPAYDTNDDATIRGVLEGTRVPGQPATGFALLPHAALGWFIVATRYVWSGAYAWDIAVTGTLLWGLAIFGSLVWGASGSAVGYRLAAITIAVAALLPLVGSVQYTISATIAGGAAIALAWCELRGGSSARRSVLAMAAALLTLGLLLRSGGAMAGALAVSACLLPRAMQTGRRGMATIGALVGGSVALFAVLHVADVAIYKLRPEWDAYRQLNYFITAMFDWNWQAVLPSAVDVTGARSSVGWTANDWTLLEHAWGVNPELFNLERVRTFYEATVGLVRPWDYFIVALQRLWTVDRNNLAERLSETWPVLSALVVLVAFYLRRVDVWVTLAVALCFVAYCLGVQVGFKSLPFRLLAPMVACFVVVVLATIRVRRTGKVLASFVLVVVLALCGYQAYSVLAAMAANRRHSLQVDAEGAALAALRPSLVVIHTDTFPEEHWQRPFHRPAVRLLMIRLGRNNQNPQLLSFLQAAGLSRFPSAICDNPSVLVISERGRLEVVTTDMQERYSRIVEWNPLYMASFRAWQCLPAPAG